jgi:uncharacterized protein (DUF302 family)
VQDTAYGIRIELPVSYEEAIERATAALKTEGFGVLTTIDVKATIKQKLDKDFRKYTILGACNPPIAYKALSAETELGLLLPCNVIVYETEPGKSVVSAIAPLVSMSRAANAELAPLGNEVDAKLRRVLAALETEAAGA